MVQDTDAAGPDFGFMAFQTTGWQPPDPECAVGPRHVVSVVNMTLRIHDKEGTLLFDQLFEDFWAATSGGDFLFDPVALYDHHAGRFVIVTADHQGNQDGLNVAVSIASDPTEGWHKYFFDTDHVGDSIDFENLGMGPDAYYVTADYFSSWRNVIHILEKAPMLNGDAVTLRHHRTANELLSLAAVKSYDSAPPAQYFADQDQALRPARSARCTDRRHLRCDGSELQQSAGRHPEGFVPPGQHAGRSDQEWCLPQRIAVADPQHRRKQHRAGALVRDRDERLAGRCRHPGPGSERQPELRRR